MVISTGKVATAVASVGIAFLTTASVLAASPDAHRFALGSPNSEPVREAPRPQHLWSMEAVRALQAEALAAEAEGLDPRAYALAALDAALAREGESETVDRLATDVALALARDYAHGRVTERRRFDWHIEADSADPDSLAGELQLALKEKRLRHWLRSLLPGDPRYVALREAYAATPREDREARDSLRANLERWRWMPRSLGPDHIYVNVPSYTLAVVDEGRPVSTYTVVVGKPSTPTPQIAVEARSIVVNPWWNVPPSIARGMNGRAGFIVGPGGMLRQPPGPGNALGKVKIDMPNPHAIYLHDTPSKALFGRESRAFSHGCIRVKDIDRLATELVALDSGNPQPVRKALAGSATRTMSLPQARPVYLVYFTADVGEDGRVIFYEDPYRRDRRLVDALENATQVVARTSTAAGQG